MFSEISFCPSSFVCLSFALHNEQVYTDNKRCDEHESFECYSKRKQTDSKDKI